MQRENIEILITNYERRLQKLKEQQSTFGLHTPAHILTEMEDVEAAIGELQRELEILKEDNFNKDYQRALSELAEDTSPKQWVQIYLQGDFSSVSADRRSAAVAAFAAAIGISPHAVRVYRIYEGSIVLNLGIPFYAIQSLRIRLQSNSAQLRVLKIEKVILQRESGEIEVWVDKEGRFDSVSLPETSSVHGKFQKIIGSEWLTNYSENLPQQMILALSNAVVNQIVSSIEGIYIEKDQPITRSKRRQPAHLESGHTPRRLTKSDLVVLKRTPRSEQDQRMSV